ncbi:MAG: hypothetical protein ACLPX9_14925 [Rhodomicrobium sp.]
MAEESQLSGAQAPVSSVLRASGPGGDGAGAPYRSDGPDGAGEEPSLEGLRILVVEDEFLLALEVEAVLIGFGCAVIGPFAKLAKALGAARSTPVDGAVLDINLNGEMVFPLAEFLDSQGVPFVFLTGYVTPCLPERFRGFRRLQKPLRAETLRRVCLDMRPVGT